jgi:hypothetical protein
MGRMRGLVPAVLLPAARAAAGTGFEPPQGPFSKSFEVHAPDPSLRFAEMRTNLGSRFSIALPGRHAKVKQALSLVEVIGRPKMPSARYARAKGAGVEAKGLSKKGLPKRVFASVGRVKQDVLVLSIVVDEREARRHENLFKQICSKSRAER